jgi:hypothetical protein
MSKQIGLISVLIFMTVASSNRVESQDGFAGDIHVRHNVGVVHHEIAESSPIISASITSKNVHYSDRDGVQIYVHYMNISDHDLPLQHVGIVLFITESNGNLAPETDSGCSTHWFSTCYYTQNSEITVAFSTLLKPGGKVQYTLDPYTEYKLTHSQTYTVTGYVLTNFKGEEKYFKTNTITITAP